MRFMKASPEFKPLRLARWDAFRTARCTRSRQVPWRMPLWIDDLLCDLKKRPHMHAPLESKVVGGRPGASQKLVWYTSLAAEFTEGMCNKFARDYEGHLKENGRQKVPPVPCTADVAPLD